MDTSRAFAARTACHSTAASMMGDASPVGSGGSVRASKAPNSPATISGESFNVP